MRRRTFFIAAGVLSSAVILSAAQPIAVTPVVHENRVLASFSTPASFTEDIHDIVKTGLVVTFSYTVDLRRPSTVWFDHTLTSTTVAASVKFDNLTGVYQVSKLVDGRVFWSEQTRELNEVRQWMTAFEKVPLVTRTPLEPNADYYVEVTLRASPKRTLSLWPWSGEEASGRADFTFIR